MSRIGKKPIKLPKAVKVELKEGQVFVKGPKGDLKMPLHESVELKLNEDEILVVLKSEHEESGNFHGLMRSLIENMVEGTNNGFQKVLEMHGVGFRAAVKGKFLDLQIGYSHPTQVEIPSDLNVKVEQNTLINISGPNKQRVGQFAADIRGMRPPEPYKGKGIRYKDEYVRRKAGKSAK